MYAETRAWTSDTVELGSTATRAPSRAALVRTCQVWYARPNSKMLTDTSRSSGSVSAVSMSAVPRALRSRRTSPLPCSGTEHCGDGADGDRRGVRESVVDRTVFDFSDIAPSGSHERCRALHRFLQPPPPDRDGDREHPARNRRVEKRRHDVCRAEQGADRRKQLQVARAGLADHVARQHQQETHAEPGERAR